MQSDTLWFKKLARSKYQDGRWITEQNPPALQDPYQILSEDLLEALDIYNQHTSRPIKALKPGTETTVIMTLLLGSVQIRLTRNENFLDISLIRTRDFQTFETPLTRLAPLSDSFGSPVWKRGTAELSTDQVIKNAFIHLIESAFNG